MLVRGCNASATMPLQAPTLSRGRLPSPGRTVMRGAVKLALCSSECNNSTCNTSARGWGVRVARVLRAQPKRRVRHNASASVASSAGQQRLGRSRNYPPPALITCRATGSRAAPTPSCHHPQQAAHSSTHLERRQRAQPLAELQVVGPVDGQLLEGGACRGGVEGAHENVKRGQEGGNLASGGSGDSRGSPNSAVGTTGSIAQARSSAAAHTAAPRSPGHAPMSVRAETRLLNTSDRWAALRWGSGPLAPASAAAAAAAALPPRSPATASLCTAAARGMIKDRKPSVRSSARGSDSDSCSSTDSHSDAALWHTARRRRHTSAAAALRQGRGWGGGETGGRRRRRREPMVAAIPDAGPRHSFIHYDAAACSAGPRTAAFGRGA